MALFPQRGLPLMKEEKIPLAFNKGGGGDFRVYSGVGEYFSWNLF